MNPGAWHPDPTGRHRHRWWDGARWTELVADDGLTGSDPLEAKIVADHQATNGRRVRSNRSWAVFIAVAVAAVGLAALVVVLAVSGDDSPPDRASPSAGEGESAECALVTTDELAAAVGSEFSGGEPIEEGGSPGCAWMSTAPPDEGLSEPLKVEIFVFPLTAEDRQVFDEVAADPANEVVALGDLAIVRCDIEADTGPGCDAYGPLFVIQGNQYLGVELSNYAWPDDLTQEEVLDALTEVGSAAVGRTG